MADADDLKSVLHRSLQDARADLVWKLDGVGERDARLPRTPTGTSLLGILKHCLNVEAGYFGPVFGREFPRSDELVAPADYAQEPQADWLAREDETKDGLVDLYRRVGAFADQTVVELPLDAPGSVPWWTEGPREVTLQQVLVRVSHDLARHAGHADVLREVHDGSVGWHRDNPNVPDGYDWPAYVARATDLAHRFP